MPQRKPVHITTYHDDESGIEADVLLDPSSGTFYATVGDRKLTAESKDALIGQLERLLPKLAHLEWTPAIQIMRYPPNYSTRPVGPDRAFQTTRHIPGEAFLHFTIKRGYLARRVDGLILWSEWDNYEPDKGSDMRPVRTRNLDGFGWSTGQPLVLPHTGSIYTFVAYAEELWAGLEQLVANVQAVRDRLDEMLLSEQGQALIATLGQGLMALPAPDKDTSDEH